MQKGKRWDAGCMTERFPHEWLSGCFSKNDFLIPIWTSAYSPWEKYTWNKKKNQQNFESSDIITHRLQAKNCLLLRYYWLLGWRLHHIKPPCQVGAFGRSTTRECSFPLMFWTSCCRVSLGGKLWIITTWEDDADVPHQTYCHRTENVRFSKCFVNFYFFYLFANEIIIFL